MPSTHSETSPSSAERWMACPASVELSAKAETVFGPEPSSPYAEEGTRLHGVAATLASRWINSVGALEKCIDAKVGTSVSAEDAECLRPYLLSIEQDLDFSDQESALIEQYMVWHEDLRIAGTADAIVLAHRELIVTDLKTGAGKYVPADCMQLQIYGFLAAQILSDPIDTITLRVVQPRFRGLSDACPAVREVSFDAKEFISRVRAELLAALARIDAPNPPAVEGGHCQWCPAAAICPLKTKMIHDALNSEPLDKSEDPEKSKKRVLYILNNAAQIEKLIKSARSSALGLLLEGGQLEGWGLKDSYANRAWVDEAETSAELERMGLSEDDLYLKKIISPAQAEKLLGKGAVDDLTRRELLGKKLTPEKGASPLDYSDILSEEEDL